MGCTCRGWAPLYINYWMWPGNTTRPVFSRAMVKFQGGVQIIFVIFVVACLVPVVISTPFIHNNSTESHAHTPSLRGETSPPTPRVNRTASVKNVPHLQGRVDRHDHPSNPLPALYRLLTPRSNHRGVHLRAIESRNMLRRLLQVGHGDIKDMRRSNRKALIEDSDSDSDEEWSDLDEVGALDEEDSEGYSGSSIPGRFSNSYPSSKNVTGAIPSTEKWVSYDQVNGLDPNVDDVVITDDVSGNIGDKPVSVDSWWN